MDKQTFPLPVGVGTTTDVAWAPDGTQLAVVTDYGWLLVWQTTTGVLQMSLRLGRTLAVGSANGALYRIEHLTDPQVTTHALAHPVTHLAWSCSPVGRCLVVSGHTLTVLDGRGVPPVTKQYAMPILDASWSADGRTLAVVCEDGPIEVWDMDRAVNVLTISHIPHPRCLAWHRDGRHVSIGTTTGSIQICDVRAKRCRPWFQVSASPIQALKWGVRYLAVASQTAQNTLHLMDETGHTTSQPMANVFTWNPQGNVLACGHHRQVALTTL